MALPITKFGYIFQGNLLFTSGVMKNAKLYNSPLLLSGKRSDLQLDKNKITNIRGEREIDIAFKKSHISYGYAEDYFVVNNKFPWKIYPNLVIGRAMVDNYLAYVSRTSKVNINFIFIQL
jgi:hypothetical protein